VAALHTLLGALTVLCTFCLARRCDSVDAPERFAIAAALLVTLDPLLVQQSRLVMSETLATTLSAVVFWLWARAYRFGPTRFCGAQLGVALALAYLCRPVFLVWAVMMVGIVFLGLPADRRKRWRHALMVLTLVVTAVVTWTIRNQRILGHPVWATTHGGYTLLLANNPSFYRYLREGEFGRPWDATAFFDAHAHRYDADPTEEQFWNRAWNVPPGPIRGDEVQDNQLCYRAAMATIGREPQMFLWSCLVRLGRLWSPFPHATPDRSLWVVRAVGAFYVLVYIMVIVGLWRHRRRVFCPPWWPAWALAVTLSLVHAVYWSNLRMRSPIVPAIAIAAAAAITRPRRSERCTVKPNHGSGVNSMLRK
jgi:4-amino-4-deoxy-L-arabinose transferase-like glycosyltransferase